MQVLIGADPELFVRRAGEFRSAHGLIPGDKKNPHVTPHGAVQVDGLALEFNIPPAINEDMFVNSIDEVLAELRAMVPEEYEFDFSASARFDKKHLNEQPKEALVLGCDPDWDGYTRRQNPAPKDPGDLRAAGGHVHVGWCKDWDVQDPHHIDNCAELARQLDFLLAVPSILLDPDVDRRTLYGTAGAFRPKPYGMEYRTLSNFWVKDPALRRAVYQGTQKAVDMLIDQEYQVFNDYGYYGRSMIQKNSKAEALKFIQNHNNWYAGWNEVLPTQVDEPEKAEDVSVLTVPYFNPDVLLGIANADAARLQIDERFEGLMIPLPPQQPDREEP